MKYDFGQLQAVFEEIDEKSVACLVEAIEGHGRIFLYGAGRSGLMLKALAMRLSQMGKTVYAVGEVVTPAIEKGDLLITASASGTTASVCRNAQIAKEVGASVYAITASAASPLVSFSDGCVLLATPTKDCTDGGSLMGTLFEQAVLLLGDRIIAELPTDAAQMRARHANLE
ncbi:MAG: SIS domain-containing protein [Clostridia bacterium]|nr:SIS domain-containing protein [Clostridia bacterium]